ncbi:MAG: T9SS type A sorting domain-containing protein [Bacteroidetes bacterium]|nr:T9SS type A sorting domain-containing protein [Bacteroidota bacterium]
MKKQILALSIFVALFSFNAAFGQITLEHKYESKRTEKGLTLPKIVFLDNKTQNYFTYVQTSTGLYDSVFFYHLNHTLNISGSFPKNPNGIKAKKSFVQGFSYFSKSLFDCDSTNLEFLVQFVYYDSIGTSVNSVQVFRTDASIIFAKDSMFCDAYLANPIYPKSVVNTNKGTKLLLFKANNLGIGSNFTYVYSLCGTLPTGYNSPMHNPADDNNGTLYDAYPNPSKEYTHIDYKLPNGVNTGEIIFCDMQGKTIKTMKVGSAFNDVLISTDDLPAGQYLYYLKTNGSVTGAKKLVTVK